MAGEWRGCTIGELCDEGVVELQTGPFGTQLHAHDYVEDGVPVVPTEAIRNRQIDHSVLPKISPGKAKELMRHRLELGDILFARRGVQATGHIGCVREAEEGFLCGTGAIRLRLRKGGGSVSPDFLSHVLANPASVEWFKFHAIGATMPNLNEGIIRSFPLQIPPLPEQRAIAHILGTLDDKIELNRRMNETLEAIARALFKSWFIDFDPVRAKAEGRDPGLHQSLADLFPNSLEDSELGEVPRGWRVTNWGELISLEYGKSLKNYDRSNEAYPVYGTNGMIGSHSRPLCGHPGIIIGRKGAYRGVHFCSTPFFVIDTAFYVEPKEPIEQRWAYYELLRQDINSMDSGSAIPSTSREDFYNLGVLSPPFKVQQAFAELLSPFWARQEHNDRESSALAALRDTLLPKLITGELRIKDAERIVEVV